MNEKKEKYLTAVLIAITCIAISVTIWALFIRKPEQILTPDYAPVEVEAHAETMQDEEEEGKLEQQEGGGAVSLMYSTEVSIGKSDKTVSLLFGNPSKSNQDMVVQIVVQDTILVQSGLLKPGSQVTSLDIADTSMLQPGTYEGTFKVLYYQPDSGEKAIVNTEIPIEITVSE